MEEGETQDGKTQDARIPMIGKNEGRLAKVCLFVAL
jgi:hypothetical protein